MLSRYQAEQIQSTRQGTLYSVCSRLINLISPTDVSAHGIKMFSGINKNPSMRSILNTVCSSYLKHPASAELLAAHSTEGWARWTEPCQSCWSPSLCCQTNKSLTDKGF